MSARRSYTFLTSGRWVGLLIAGLIVVTACIFLGFWQWGRYEYKRDLVAQFDAAYDAPTQSIEQVLAGGIAIDRSREWQPVTLTGQWVASPQLLLRNRAVDGRNAYRVLALLHTHVVDVVVDRGWLPVTDNPPTPPPLPHGPITIQARLRPPEPADSRGIVDGFAQAINPSQLAEPLNHDATVPLLSGYAQASDGLDGLTGYPRPERDLGPHLSYAFQWWVFALGTVVGLVILARREAAENAGIRPPRPQRATAETEEDALLDKALL